MGSGLALFAGGLDGRAAGRRLGFRRVRRDRAEEDIGHAVASVSPGREDSVRGRDAAYVIAEVHLIVRVRRAPVGGGGADLARRFEALPAVRGMRDECIDERVCRSIANVPVCEGYCADWIR